MLSEVGGLLRGILLQMVAGAPRGSLPPPPPLHFLPFIPSHPCSPPRALAENSPERVPVRLLET